jgi:aspartyl-tRNA(Asn)/glutamyl-tRNA(Gln) amidotransferase subunit B
MIKPDYTADIGLEVHAELQTQSKMFCTCPVIDLTQAVPNTATCPVCAGMPGTLPVVNARAVDYALQVALALECTVATVSRFARKNYFYPDLPKGYQISQYEFPLAQGGVLPVRTEDGWLNVRIRRVHLEEDTAKLTHIQASNGETYSLVDLNRAGIPLLEIVSEPDLHSVEQVRAYTRGLRTLLQYLAVNTGDLEKGVIRFEANVSLRPRGSTTLGTRVEIKNLNSFRSMTAAIAFELGRQAAILKSGGKVAQETLGWDELKGVTHAQRSKEEAHDYRYFPEPDLPPLVITPEQLAMARGALPERPDRRFRRFLSEFGLDAYQTDLLTTDKAIADYFEETLTYMETPDPTLVANWITGELFALMNANGQTIDKVKISPENLGVLLDRLQLGVINTTTGKIILAQAFDSGENPSTIIQAGNLGQISDRAALGRVVDAVLSAHPQELDAYHSGKTALRGWFFGQVMRMTRGQANPALIEALLDEKLSE